MTKEEKQAYLKIAKNTGVFNPIEIETLDVVLDDCGQDTELNYILLEERQDERVVGFIIFDKVAITEFAWDIYWLMVDKDSQGKGIGKKLLSRMEEFILQKHKKAILRVETSTKKEYIHAHNLYQKKGFRELGRIEDFYTKDDDLIIYTKTIE